MGSFILIIVRIASFAAMWSAWGWLVAGLALLSLIIFGPPKTSWGTINFNSPRAYVRVITEVGFLVAGLIAANSAWGIVWAAALTIAYIVSFVIK